MFSKPSAAALAERAVPVRIDSARPETRDFVARHKVQLVPALFVMNADEHVLVTVPPGDRTLEVMLAAIDEAERREKAFTATAARTDVEGRIALARLLVERHAWDEARSLYTGLLAGATAAAAHDGLVRLEDARGDLDAERRAAEGALAALPDDPLATSWRVRLATQEFRRTRNAPAALASIARLRTLLGETREPLAQAEVKVALADLLSRARQQDEAHALLDQVLAAYPRHARIAPSALLARANIHWRIEEYDRAEALLQRILDEHPASEEAASARVGLPNCRSMAEAKGAKK